MGNGGGGVGNALVSSSAYQSVGVRYSCVVESNTMWRFTPDCIGRMRRHVSCESAVAVVAAVYGNAATVVVIEKSFRRG